MILFSDRFDDGSAAHDTHVRGQMLGLFFQDLNKIIANIWKISAKIEQNSRKNWSNFPQKFNKIFPENQQNFTVFDR